MEMNQQKDDEIEIDLRELFGVLISKIGIIILSGITLGLIVLIGTKLFITPQYQSVTKFYVLNKEDSNALTSQDMQTSTLLTKDYAELIKSRTVTEGVIADLGLDISHNDLLSKLTVTTPTDTRIVTISVDDPDPYVAAQIANAVRDIAATHIQKVMNTEAVNVVEEANIPQSPVSPSVIKNGVIGGVVGLFLAVALILVIYLMNDTIQTSEDVERYLNMSALGVIPVTDLESNEKKKKAKAHKRH